MDQSKWFENTGTPPSLPKVDILLNGDEPSYPGVPCIRYGVNPVDWDWSKSLSDSSSIRRWRAPVDIWKQVNELKMSFVGNEVLESD